MAEIDLWLPLPSLGVPVSTCCSIGESVYAFSKSQDELSSVWRLNIGRVSAGWQELAAPISLTRMRDFWTAAVNEHDILILGGASGSEKVFRSTSLHVLDINTLDVRRVYPNNRRRVWPKNKVVSIGQGVVVYQELEDLQEFDYRKSRMRQVGRVIPDPQNAAAHSKCECNCEHTFF